MVTILTMLAKMATLGLLKVKLFWRKGYDVTISVHDITNKILSHGSNYTVDMFVCPKFGNFSIFMKEVIITSILSGFEQKNHFSRWVVLVQVH